MNANQQKRRRKQLGRANCILAEQPGLREQTIGSKACRPVIQLSENGLGFGCIGEFEPQAVEKDQRSDTRDDMRCDGFDFGKQSGIVGFRRQCVCKCCHGSLLACGYTYEVRASLANHVCVSLGHDGVSGL